MWDGQPESDTIPEWVGIDIKHTAELFQVEHLRTQESPHSELMTVCCCQNIITIIILQNIQCHSSDSNG